MSAPRPPSLGFSGGDALTVGTGFVMFTALATVLSFLGNRRFVEADAEQPVEFSHRLHVLDEGLECQNCHPFYERRAMSGLPAASTCAMCHDESLGESAEEQRLVALLEAGKPLLWDSIFRQPPHVFFSHRLHVTVAELECATCHGDIGSSERSPRERRPLSMQECIDCHEVEGRSSACTSCHR